MSLLFQSFFLHSFCIPAFLICAEFFSPVTSDINCTDAGVLATELICFPLDTKHEQNQLINHSLFALRCAETTDGTDAFGRASASALCRIRQQQKRIEKEFVKESLQRPRGPCCKKRPTSDK